MNAERHYDEDTLIALMESDRDSSDPHLPSCPACSETLESVRMIADALKDDVVWAKQPFSEEPVSATIFTLRAAAIRIEDEDAQAETLVRELLGGSRDSWRAKLDAHPEYATAGMVRKLIAAASRAVDTMPPDAVEIAAIATRIADSLDDQDGWTPALRGAARREHAYALYYTGQFAHALIEADHADAQFAKCVVGEFDRARVGIVRALALRALERWKEALSDARNSVRTFGEFGDADRVASACIAEAHLLFSLRDFDQAIVILAEQDESLRRTDHVETHARVLMNLGYAFWQNGKTVEGAHHYETAIGLFRELGITTEAARIQWAFARMLRDAGQSQGALKRFRELAVEFDRVGMACEAALVGLDVAELILEDQKFAEVEEISIRAMRSFDLAGVSYTAKALTALGYLREATRNRTATPKLVRHVRDYIRRLPAEEKLLFVPL